MTHIYFQGLIEAKQSITMVLISLNMLCLLTISVIIASCSAVDLKQTSVSTELSSTSSQSNPVTQWIELYNQVFNARSDGGQLNSVRLRTILQEMHSIEQMDMFKSDTKNQLGELNHFDNLVAEACEGNILTDPESTITDLLLQTFDYHANDCIPSYFDLLNEIHETFVHNKPIQDLLQENREKQYRDCWARFKHSLDATTKLIGARVIRSLDKFVAFVYPNNDKIIKPITEPGLPEFREESIRIAELVAKFLGKLEDEATILAHYKHLIEQPCQTLIDTTINVMMHIFVMLNFSGYDQEFLSNDDKKIINRYTLCDRILADSRFISQKAMEYKENLGNKAIILGKRTQLDGNEDIRLPKVSTELRLGPSLMDSSVLITQNLSSETDSSPINAVSTSETESDQCHSLENKRRKIEVGDDNSSNVQPERIIRVSRGFGKGRTMQFPTIWSDGHVTVEMAAYLKSCWPNAWNEMLLEQQAISRASSQFRSNETTQKLKESHKEKKLGNSIVRIDRGIGKGRIIGYPVFWSDRSVTIEDKDYLMKYWPDAWNALCKELKAIDEARYLAKKASASQLNEEIGNEFKQTQDESNDHKTIVEIEKGIGRGLQIKYPVRWSDGTRSIESRKFLEEKWPGSFQRFSDQLIRAKHARYRARKKSKKNQMQKSKTTDM